ncbi:MAG: hypothetical protein AB7V46_04650, partial [Thermomicrobiales bacterium]
EQDAPEIPAVAQIDDGTPFAESQENSVAVPQDVATPGSNLAELPAATPEPETQVSTANLDGAIFPTYRVISYYGFPEVPQMGILGEYAPQELLTILQDQAAAFEEADPGRPTKLALEVITSVAQGWQGDDGDYLAYIGRDQLMEYVEFTQANDMLLILDMQFGRKTVQEEFEAVREFLLYPHVHLALDPEFAIDEGEVPAQNFGDIDASDVQYALEELALLAEENNLPPKILVVHQFYESSISNRDQIQLVPGVQFVLEVDGFGSPDAKRGTYDTITYGSPSEFFGFKLWYNPAQDYPLMTPAEIIELDPSPDLVIYQ